LNLQDDGAASLLSVASPTPTATGTTPSASEAGLCQAAAGQPCANVGEVFSEVGEKFLNTCPMHNTNICSSGGLDGCTMGI